MKLTAFIAATLCAGVFGFGLFVLGSVSGRATERNTPEHEKRERILMKSCIKRYVDREGYIRFSGCKLGGN